VSYGGLGKNRLDRRKEGGNQGKEDPSGGGDKPKLKGDRDDDGNKKGCNEGEGKRRGMVQRRYSTLE